MTTKKTKYKLCVFLTCDLTRATEACLPVFENIPDCILNFRLDDTTRLIYIPFYLVFPRDLVRMSRVLHYIIMCLRLRVRVRVHVHVRVIAHRRPLRHCIL